MRWMIVLVALALSACAHEIGPSPEELKGTWEAQNVYPAGYKTDILAFMRTYLNDPTHVRNPSVSAPQLKLLSPNDRGERYVACVRFTARNTDGKYNPPKEGAATFVSGKLDRFLDSPRETHEFCKDAVFAPFFELEKLTR